VGFLDFRFNGLLSINWESALSHKLMQELFNRVGIAPRGPMGARLNEKMAVHLITATSCLQ